MVLRFGIMRLMTGGGNALCGMVSGYRQQWVWFGKLYSIWVSSVGAQATSDR